MAPLQGSTGEIRELARYIHGESTAVKKLAGILYPNCLAPVEFIEYKQVDANAAFRRV